MPGFTFRGYFSIIIGALTLYACSSGGGSPQPIPDTPPRVVSISPSGPLGLPGESVAFSAVTEGDIVAWEWQFPAFVSPGNSTMATSIAEIKRPGSGNLELVVRSRSGEFASGTIALSAGVPVSPGWSIVNTIAPIQPGFPDNVFASSIALVDELPAILFTQPATGFDRTIFLARPEAGVFNSQSPWHTTEVVTTPSGGNSVNMLLIELASGQLALGYGASNLTLAVSTSATPQLPGDWTHFELAQDTAFLDMAIYQGRLVMVGIDFGSSGPLGNSLNGFQALNAMPQSASDFGSELHIVGSDDGLRDGEVSLLASETQLSVAYVADARVQVDPQLELFWQFTTDSILDSNSFTSEPGHFIAKGDRRRVNAIWLHGRPLILNGKKLHWAATASPNQTSDWREIELPSEFGGGSSFKSVALESGNRLALLQDGGSTGLIAGRAISTDIPSASDIVVIPVLTPFDGLLSGLSAVALPDGRIFATYHPTEGVDELRFLVSDGPW